ncbi:MULTISPECIES: type II secretion system F family protein [unclassified Paenibacillus]|uniref:type II secretion system F family protein n=1 Tax=unclassified Paenibacillus TaxID=185978 RepID=UPI0009A5E5E7|nr:MULTISPECIES: type II secretion system F family protein [unclassified Paenibacillus]SLK04003.1 type II secretion system protein F (GspF) [Paenibacillus sp. RU5A]SOC69507.1 type II secretion system protein F (GspF) [Paenibacillus sp. RU26A]SOC71953.1 type II secretion system protein F (GspF) [Paenibacillus sp. RU5M]
MLLPVIFGGVLGAGWLVLDRTRGQTYRHLRKLDMEGIRLKKLHGPFLFLLDKFEVGRRLPVLMFRMQHAIQKMYGIQHSGEKTMLYCAEMLTYSWLMLLVGCLLALVGDMGLGGMVGGLALGAALPFALYKDLNIKVQRRDQDILMELPELLNRIVLLVGAGETVQRAIVHCVASQGERNHPLYNELRKTVGDWNNGYSFQQSFEQFSRRCGVQEVTIFTTTVLLNFRRGGGDFVLALRDLSHVLWEKRKAVSRAKGEQASSKLVFPMVLIFFSIVVMIGAPAFMMMNM